MDSRELRRRFLEFFEKRGHAVVPSSSLIPDDPSVLLTTAGMQQFKAYYTELDPEKTVHPSLGKPVGLNAVSCQKSFRTSDIDEVGDESHLTFFEMLGNFSFGPPATPERSDGGRGGYFKKEAIKYAKEFLESVDLNVEYVTVFTGDEKTPSDEESFKIWQELGVKDIRKAGREDNFWGPTGNEGPCGPTTEIYIGGTEIWNIVFNEYYQKSDGSLEKLKTPGVDTGMGLERLAMVSQKQSTIFETDLFLPIIQSLPTADTDQRVKRIIVDHARAIAFLIADGVRPSNKGQGYILRRLIRRSIIHVDLKQGGSFSGMDTRSIGVDSDMKAVLEAVVKKYADIYPELKKGIIFSVFDEERKKFGSAYRQGLKELQKLERIDAAVAFKMFESYGLPLELVQEFSGEKARDITKEDFEKEMERHRQVSRAGKERKFGGHGLILDTGELKAVNEEELQIVTRLHTATHLLQAALRKVLGEGVHQAGSDITAERTRFDFTFDRKLTDEEVRQTELLVNDMIRQNLDLGYKEMPFREAIGLGALYSPREKYPDTVKVYSAQNSETGEVFSRELCGGPHVRHTEEVGEFRIGKQEAVSAGVRRIRGHLLKTS